MSDIKNRLLQLKYGELSECCSAMMVEYNECDISPVSKSEALRYSGVPISKQDDTLDGEFDEICKIANNSFSYKVSYVVHPLYFDDGKPRLIFSHNSKSITENLEGSVGVVYFAATIGAGIDALIRKYEKISPFKALLLQGLGAERVEALCDKFNGEVIKSANEYGFNTAQRFSPGYGDLSLEAQKTLLPLVNATKLLGITLSESLLMAPSKSVTAIIGIKK